jgi:tetratricopeptide (TPR) repeat protein
VFYNRVMKRRRRFYRYVAGFLLSVPGIAFQHRPLTAPELVRQGRLDEALAIFRQDTEIAPKSVAAWNGVGVVLDLQGHYAEARRNFAHAIKIAVTSQEKVAALRAMAVAWGFTGDCKNAGTYETDAFQAYVNSGDYPNAGEVANEMGRLCIDAGDLGRSREWYTRGHDAGLDEPNITPARRDLWDFRWAHAQARLAVRRGKIQEAQKYVAATKAILDKGTNPEQREYFPYLAGYVAFYSGDYPGALRNLKEAAIADPFIQCLTAQVYEKMGDTENAQIYYRRAASTTAHSVAAAYARPFATKKLR